MFNIQFYANLLIAIGAALIKYTEIVKISPEEMNTYRLPSNVRPLNYNITLEPFFTRSNFSGHVEIDIQLTEISDQITFHSFQQFIDDVQIFDAHGTEISHVEPTFDYLTQFVTINFTNDLDIGLYKLKMNYSGVLNDLNVGFYKTSYVDVNGTIRSLAATQFEATEARRAFPCFDEPALKATFDINLVRTESYHSLSNMKLSHTWQKGEKFVDVFEKSPNMSTYLVAFVISDFTYIANNEQFRIFARPEAIANGEANLALEMGSAALRAVEAYTKIPFSLKKSDQIAIPGFPFNAMENWGLVIFSEHSLLWNASTSLTLLKQEILVQMSHEFVHQWFGNLVTPKWWKYLWLNEGFATFLSHQIAQTVKPMWRMAEQFMDVMHLCLEVDSKQFRPISFDVNSPGEIMYVFDEISYMKAGLVLRMLQHAITDLLFSQSLTKYLTRRQYRAAESADLWRAIQETLNEKAPNFLPPNLTISEIMTTWETQPNYPVITVTRNYTGGDTNFTQETFYVERLHPKDTTKWYIPITWTPGNEPNFTKTSTSLWLTKQASLYVPTNLVNEEWLIVNTQATGYYRVNYDVKNWMLISNYLNTADYEKIHLLNRAQLIDDAFNLARSGRLSYSVAFSLTNYLHHETDYIVHSTFFRVLTFLNKMASGSALYNRFEERVGTILEKALTKLGYKETSFDDDEHINNLHRADVISWACQMHNAACRSYTTAKLYDIPSVSVNLQAPIICGGLRGADQAIWNMVDEYGKTVTGTIKSVILSALGCSENDDVLKNYVKKEMAQNSIAVFKNIFEKGNFGRNFVWNYVLIHFDDIYQKFGDDAGEILVDLSPLITTEDQLYLFHELMGRVTVGLKPSFETALGIIKDNIKWTDVFLHDITTWIRNELKKK